METCHSLDAVFARFSGRRDELIPILQAVQDKLGYLPEDAMLQVARFTGVPESSVYAVATFYGQFRFTPIGRTHLTVCRGTSCHVRGAPRILEVLQEHLGIKEGETSPDRQYSLETVACLGACGQAPCVMANEKIEANVTPEKLAELFPKATHHE